jgi:VWFA-related protein
MRRDTVRATVLAILLAGGSAAPGQAQDDAARLSAPAHLDLFVTDAAGRPVAGLQPSDIELRDQGIEQVVERVTFVSRANTPDEAPGSGRTIGLLLDEFHIDPAHTLRVREALTRFVADELRPGDVIVLVKPLDSLAGLLPSGDRAELTRRIDAFEGRRGDYEPRTPFEEATMSRAPATAAAERARVVLSALSALTARLGTLGEGRKSLVFVSEGMGEPPARGRLRGPTLEAITEAASRADVAIYTLAPGSPDASGDPDAGRAALRALAEETGGVHAEAGHLEEGLGLAARDLDGYYRVAYRPEHRLDGRHPIEVRVQRAGAQVRARAAHWAVPDPVTRSAPRPAISTLSALLPRRPQQVSPLIATWWGTARGSDDRTRVTFTWEPRARVQTPPAWLTLTATDVDGAVLFEGRVDPIRTVGVGGVPTLSAIFEAPPGLVQIDMTIHDASGRAVDVDRRDIPLPDLRRAGTLLSTPAVIRTHNNLQFRTLSADPLAPPSVSRRFSRSERLLVRVHAYPDPSGSGRPDVTARLIGRGYETLRELTPLPDAPAEDLVQFDVSLAGMAAGEYGIEIRAGDRRELVLFDVGN